MSYRVAVHSLIIPRLDILEERRAGISDHQPCCSILVHTSLVDEFYRHWVLRPEIHQGFKKWYSITTQHPEWVFYFRDRRDAAWFVLKWMV